MIKRNILVLCLVLLLCLPVSAHAQDARWSVLDMQYAMIGENMPMLQQADGSYQILGGDSARSHFAPEKITIDIEKGFRLTLVNTLFHHKDFRAIQSLLEDYHRLYFSSLASGSWRLFGRDHFTGDDIYEEANARTVTMMFMNAAGGEKNGDGAFSYDYDVCEIAGDLCKVVLTRSAAVTDSDSGKDTIEDQVREGFLLEKVDGEWKIANIIFDGTDVVRGDPERIFSGGKVNMLNLFEKAAEPETWQKSFDFAHCQRQMLTTAGNYTSYLKGDFSAPQFDYAKLYNDLNGPAA